MPTKSAPPIRVPAPRQRKAPEYKVSIRPIAQILPYERNAKIHTPAAIAKLADAIDRVGILVPIVVDAAGVIAKGHRTRLALLQLGYTSAPVHVARDATEEQLRLWRLEDNRLSEDSPWDTALQQLELSELQTLGMDLTRSAFDPPDLARILSLDDGQPDAASVASGSASAGTDQFLCVVTCKDERDLESVYEELQSRGYACKLVT